MTERDKKQAESSAQMREELFGYVNKSEFGTPQFQAISDFILLSDLSVQLDEDKDYKRQVMEGKSEIDFNRESRLRINEYRIALISNQIDQNKTTMKGYQRSFDFISISLANTTEQTSREPESAKEYDHDEAKIYNTLYNNVKDIINKKRNES